MFLERYNDQEWRLRKGIQIIRRIYYAIQIRKGEALRNCISSFMGGSWLHRCKSRWKIILSKLGRNKARKDKLQ